MSSNALAILDDLPRYEQALATAESIPEVMLLRKYAKMAAEWAHQQQVSLEKEQEIAEYRLRTERKLGLFLLAMKKNRGVLMGGRDGFGDHVEVTPTASIPTLKDMDINGNQSSQWQAIARLPEHKFVEKLDEAIAKGRLPTTAGLSAYARNWLKGQDDEDYQDCPVCDARGWNRKPCPTCRGEGRLHA